jgi:hypothetical protein
MKKTAAFTELEHPTPFGGLWDTEGEIKAGPSEQPAKLSDRCIGVATRRPLPAASF